ncbi:MAG: hypothetical protein PHW96_03320 [Candidatus Nanoarchaeia archaeon]|nr:hypothetical protein [Candidatus Nanoarchaeia archaeon]
MAGFGDSKNFKSYFDATPNTPRKPVKLSRKKVIAMMFFVFGLLSGVVLGSYGTATGNAVFMQIGDNIKTLGEGFISAIITPFAVFFNSGEKVVVDMYVMSMCPYGVQAEDGFLPVKEKFGNSIEWNLYFIGTESNGQFNSLHGQPEVDENIRQLCIIEHYASKFYDYLACLNKNYNNAASIWQSCASNAGIDTAVINSCFNGNEGKELLKASFLASQNKGATGSPTIFINGQSYSGGRTESSFTRAICAVIPSHSACAGIEVPSEVKVKVLTDSRCDDCAELVSIITPSLISQVFPNMKVEEIDYTTAEGKALYESTGLTYLPAYLFEKSVENAEGYEFIEYYIETKGNYLSLRVGASFNPEIEICDNEIDDTGNGLVDCADPDCASEWVCMEKRETPKVELFVMSHCPYGTQIEKGIIPVLELLGDKIDFELKFCDYAMHPSNGELEEQIRQYCIQKEQKPLLVEYLKCFLEAGDSSSCISQTGINEEMLEECITATDEEYSITSDYVSGINFKGSYPSFTLNQEDVNKYGVMGSPFLVINEVVAESVSRSPAGLLQAICLGFADVPEECSEVLSTSTYSAGFGYNIGTETTAECN